MPSKDESLQASLADMRIERASGPQTPLLTSSGAATRTTLRAAAPRRESMLSRCCIIGADMETSEVGGSSMLSVSLV